MKESAEIITLTMLMVIGCSREVSEIDSFRITKVVQAISPKLAIGGSLVDHKEWVFDEATLDSETVTYSKKYDSRFAFEEMTIDSISDTQILKPLKNELKLYNHCIREIKQIDLEFPVIAYRLNRRYSKHAPVSDDSLLTKAFQLLAEFDSIKTRLGTHANEFNRLSSSLGLVDSLKFRHLASISREHIVNDYVWFLSSDIKQILLKKR